jgi:hypothetical protein
MVKKSVNLILNPQVESPVIKRLKVMLPVLAGICLVSFTVTFLVSVYLIRQNNDEYEMLKNQVGALQDKVNVQKNVEGIYTLTLTRDNILNQIMKTMKDFPQIFSDINGMTGGGIAVDTVSLRQKGEVSISFNVASASELDELVSLVLSDQFKKDWTDIKAQGIAREKTGAYQLTVALKDRRLGQNDKTK